MIKKLFFPTILLTVFFISGSMLFAQENSSPLPAFQLLGSIDLGYAHNPDMDDNASDRGKNRANYYNSLVAGDPFDTEDSSACLTYGFDFDLRFFFDNIGIGAQLGYHRAEAESKISGSGWADKATYTYTLSVVPMVASLFYRMPMNDNQNSFILFGGGAGVYYAELEAAYEDKDTISGDDSFSFTGENYAIGYHILAEYDYLIGGLTLFAGIKARYVQFDKFAKGDVTLINLDGSNLEAGLTGVSVYLGAGLSI